MAAKKLKAAKKKVATPRGGTTTRKKAASKKTPKAGKRSLVPKKKANRATEARQNAKPPVVEAAPEPAVLPTPSATFVF